MSRAVAPASRWSAILFAFFLAISATSSLHAQDLPRTVAKLIGTSRADQLPAHPDLHSQQQLKGNLPSWVRAENQLPQAVDFAAPMHVSLVLSRGAALQAAFEALLAEQGNTASPLYHHWLSPRQVGQAFGPTDHDLAAIQAWALAQGLHVDSVAPHRTILELSGTTAAVANAFRVNLALYSVGGEAHLAASGEPSVPASLAPIITAVHGLVEIALRSQVHAFAAALPASQANPRPRLTLSNGAHFITPADFATIYDLGSIYTAGNNGATVANRPQHIAVIGRSRVATSDISAFASMSGLPSFAFNTVLASAADPGTTGDGDQVEATLDSERTIGTAPGAQTDLLVSGSANGYDGVYVAAAYNVDTLLDPVMSISYSGCEAQGGSAAVNLWNSLFSAAAAEGISVLVSAGDAGAAGCDTSSGSLPAAQVASINFICSSPYVTCVGGTELNDSASPSAFWNADNGTGFASVLSYIPEGAWNDPLTTTSSNGTSYAPSATGGGASQFISKPSWQSGVGVPTDGRRDVPDVAIASSAHDGYFGCLAFAGGDCSQGRFEYFFGTSAAAPGVAGIAALLNTATGSALGNLNPLLYGAAANPASGAVHDVTVASSGVTNCTPSIPSPCNNSTPGATSLSAGLSGFLVGPGYDQVTGLGSVDAARLLASLPVFSIAASPATTITDSSGVTSASLTLTVKSLDGFSGPVFLSCTPIGPAAGPSCSIDPAMLSLAAGGTATAELAVSSGFKQGTSGTVARLENPLARLGGGVLAAALLCCPPLRRRRRALLSLASLALLAAVVGGVSGCGKGTAVSAAASATPASYTFTVTASSASPGSTGAKTATTTIAVTLN